MPIVKHSDCRVFALPGITHRTVASHRDGLGGVEVWVQTFDPGAETPMHYHDCEEVLVILTGSGRVIMDGQESPIGADTTLIVPPKVVHQLINDGDQPMNLVATLSATSNTVFAPDGSTLPIPWLE